MPEIKTIADKESFDAARRVLDGLPGALGRAGVRAANKTAASGKVSVARILQKHIKEVGGGIKAADVKKQIYVNRASGKWSAAQLKIKSRGISLMHFGAKQTAVGVTTTLGEEPHAFIANTINKGAPQVFQRIGIFRIMKKGRYVGKRREVIRAVKGMTQQELMRSIPGAVPTTREEMADNMKKNMDHEVRYEVMKAAKA
jgi:hypothetical protein